MLWIHPLFDQDNDGAGGGGAGDGGAGGGGAGGGDLDPGDKGDKGDWRAALPETIRGSEFLKSVTSVDDLANQFINQQPLIGADKLVIPGANATDEQRGEFWSKLGRPGKAEEYELPKEGMPADFQVDDERARVMQTKAFALGLTAQQFAGMVRADANYQQTAREAFLTAQTVELEKVNTALKAEFGEAFDQNIAMAKAAALEFGGQDFLTYLTTSGLGNHPLAVKAWVKVGKALGSDEIKGTGGGTKHTMEPAAAEAELARLMGDDKYQKALYDKSDPGHAAADARNKELNALATPQQEEKVF